MASQLCHIATLLELKTSFPGANIIEAYPGTTAAG